VIATTFYSAETDLFAVLERNATRRTFAHLRNGSALVRYEFAPVATTDTVQSRMNGDSREVMGR
jgi:hypothetical protein